MVGYISDRYKYVIVEATGMNIISKKKCEVVKREIGKDIPGNTYILGMG